MILMILSQNRFSVSLKSLKYIQKKHLKGCIIKNGAASKNGYSRKSGASSRRKVQTSYFTKLFAKFNTRFYQLSAPDLRCPRKSVSNFKTPIKKASAREAFLMVPLVRIGLTTPPLPRVCSTTEL